MPLGETGASGATSNQRAVSGSLGHACLRGPSKSLFFSALLKCRPWESGLFIPPRYWDFSFIEAPLFGGIHTQMTNHRVATMYPGLASYACDLHIAQGQPLEGPEFAVMLCCCPLEILSHVGTRGPALSFCTGRCLGSCSFLRQIHSLSSLHLGELRLSGEEAENGV